MCPFELKNIVEEGEFTPSQESGDHPERRLDAVRAEPRNHEPAAKDRRSARARNEKEKRRRDERAAAGATRADAAGSREEAEEVIF